MSKRTRNWTTGCVASKNSDVRAIGKKLSITHRHKHVKPSMPRMPWDSVAEEAESPAPSKLRYPSKYER